LDEVPPDHRDRRRADRGGTDGPAHRRFLLSRCAQDDMTDFVKQLPEVNRPVLAAW
jgi:hypothetical protein